LKIPAPRDVPTTLRFAGLVGDSGFGVADFCGLVLTVPFHLDRDDYCSDEMEGDLGGREEVGMDLVFPSKARGY